MATVVYDSLYILTAGLSCAGFRNFMAVGVTAQEVKDTLADFIKREPRYWIETYGRHNAEPEVDEVSFTDEDVYVYYRCPDCGTDPDCEPGHVYEEHIFILSPRAVLPAHPDHTWRSNL